MSYTTEAKINKFLNITITSGDADDFISAAKKVIDMLTGRNFEADAVASERFFEGTERKALLIDECVEITKVERASDVYGETLTTIESDDYVLLPRNYLLKLIPIKAVYSKNGIWPIGVDGMANHQITAKWGYSKAVPDDISFAATVLASGMYSFNRSDGSVKSEKIGNYSVVYGESDLNAFDQAKDIIASRKRYVI